MRPLLFVLSSLVAAPLAAQGPRPFQASDVFDLEFAGDPQISPDGSRVVYVRQTPDPMTDRTYPNLWIVNVDGSGHRPLHGTAIHELVTWGPEEGGADA